MLELIFDRQLDLQIKSFNVDPALLEDSHKIEFIKDMSLALSDELHEMLAEIGWKPWAKSRHINREAMAGELIDMLHFWVNLCLAIDLQPNEIKALYLNKAAINQKRQEAGYDGVSTKCVGCGRALDDLAVKCTKDQCIA